MRHQRLGVRQTVAGRTQSDDRDSVFLKLLLVRQISVHRHENLKILRCAFEQFTVFKTGPTDEWNGFHDVSRQIASKSPIKIFIEKNFQSGGLKNLLFRFLQNGNDLFPLDAWKSFQKIIDRISGFQVIEKALHRHACPHEYNCASQNFRVGMINKSRFHAANLRRIAEPFKLRQFTKRYQLSRWRGS